MDWILWIEDVDEVAVLDHHRSGVSLLTSMATHTGVGCVNQGEVVELMWSKMLKMK